MFKIGDRVRTLTDLLADQRICGDTNCHDMPVGALGAIHGVYSDPVTGNVWSYGVLFDDDVHQWAVALDPTEIEAAQ